MIFIKMRSEVLGMHLLEICVNYELFITLRANPFINITPKELLSCQPRVTVTSCSLYKFIKDLKSIYHFYIYPIRRIGLIHK